MSEEQRPDRADKTKKGFSLRELIVSVVLVALVFCVFHVILGFVPVDGKSMQPLINTEDARSTVVILRPQGAENGSVVVLPKPNSEVNLIKRVIATGGDTVRVYRDGANPDIALIEVNGTLLKEDYILAPMLWYDWQFSRENDTETFIYENFATTVNGVTEINFTVPEGKFFALGDNRNNSRDSRHYGFFDSDTVLGRAFIIVDSTGIRFI